MTDSTKLTQQAIAKFNNRVCILINDLRELIVTDKKSASNYQTFTTAVNNILIPMKPMIIIQLFKNIVCSRYSQFIKDENDNLFSNEGIYAEYKNVFKCVVNSSGSSEYVANFILDQIVKKDKSGDNDGNGGNGGNGGDDNGGDGDNDNNDNDKIKKELKKFTNANGKFDFNKIDCDGIMKEHKTKITEVVEKYKDRWNSYSPQKKKAIWTTLKIMVYLVEKYLK